MRSTVRWSIGLSIGLFALTAAGLLAPDRRPVLAAEPAKKPAAVELVPAEGFAVLTVNAARLHDADALKPLREALEKGDKGLLRRIEEDYGLPLAQLDRVTFYLPAATFDPTSAVTLIATRTPYDKAKFLKAWKASPEPKNGGVGFGGFGQLGFAGGNIGRGVFVNPVQPVPAEPEAKPADAKPKELDLNAPFYYAGQYGETTVVPIDDKTVALLPGGVVNGGPAFVASLLRRKNEGPLADALALADKHDVVLGVSGKGLREQIETFRHGGHGEVVPGVVIDPLPVPPPQKPNDPAGPPEKVEDEYTPYEPLAAMDRAVFTFDLGPTCTLKMTAHYPTAEAAKKAEPVLAGGLKDLTAAVTELRKEVADGGKEWLPLLDFAVGGLKGAKVSLDGKTVTAAAAADIGADLKAAFATLPAKVQEAADRMKLSNNLKQIGIALHNYHDANGHLPRDVTDEDGKVLLSWRVELLPYLEQNDVYMKIDRTRGWDDPANKALWDDMPDVFKVPARPAKEKHQTYFQAFRNVNWVGKDDPWQVDAHNVTLADVTDGTANTGAVFEMAAAVNWMQPGDPPFDPKKLPAIGNPKTGKAAVVMLDGSVRTFDAKKYVGEKLAAIITVNGGEELDPDDFK